MEYYELQELWNRKGEAEIDISLNEKVMSELVHNKIRGSLSEIKWESILEIILTVFWLQILVPVIADHVNQVGILISGVILFVLSIYSLILEINKLYLISTIKYDYSIVETQRKIEKLKFLEALDINSLYFIIPLSFVPFIFVIGEGMLHIDLSMLGFGAREMIQAVIGSSLVAVVMVFILRKLELRKLTESIQFLEELKDDE